MAAKTASDRGAGPAVCSLARAGGSAIKEPSTSFQPEGVERTVRQQRQKGALGSAGFCHFFVKARGACSGKNEELWRSVETIGRLENRMRDRSSGFEGLGCKTAKWDGRGGAGGAARSRTGNGESRLRVRRSRLATAGRSSGRSSGPVGQRSSWIGQRAVVYVRDAAGGADRGCKRSIKAARACGSSVVLARERRKVRLALGLEG